MTYTIDNEKVRTHRDCDVRLSLWDGSTVLVRFKRHPGIPNITWSIQSDTAGDWGSRHHREAQWSIGAIVSNHKFYHENDPQSRSRNLYTSLFTFCLEQGLVREESA